MPSDPTGALIRNLLFIQRYSNTVSAKTRARLRELFDELAGIIAKHDPSSVQPRYRQARVEKIMQEVAKLTGQSFREIRSQVRADLSKLAVQQTSFMAETLKKATDFVVDFSRGNMSLQMAKDIIDTNPFEGLTLKQWAEGQSARTVQQVRRQIQIGMVQNEGIPELVKRVRGDVQEATAREAEAIVRTAVNDVVNTAHMHTYEANADVLTAVEWVAALDGRTCAACGAMDGRTWKLDDPDIKRPPLHWNDRCVMVAVVDWESLGLEAPDPGTRSARDEDGKSIQVSSQTRYEQWLRDAPRSVQEEVLGKGRARLFRKGKTLADLVRDDGSLVRLDELEAT